MKLKQLSLFLENRPGSLSAPCRLLHQAGLNILTLSLADTGEFGILRLVMRDWEKAKKVLEQGGCVVKVTDVVAIAVNDCPGGLAQVLETIDKAQLNVEYMYAFTLKTENKGVLVFRFDNPDKAIAELKNSQVNLIDSVQLFENLEP